MTAFTTPAITTPATSLNALYLALDFDGVLHHMSVGPTKQQLLLLQSLGVQAFRHEVEKDLPLTREKSNWLEGEGRLFDRLQMLELLVERLQALGIFSAIRIVYATSWRILVPEATLNSLLTPELAKLVVGSLSRARWEQEREEEGVRGLLMQEWLEERDMAGAAWLALDDQWRHYINHLEPHCVESHWRGLDEKAIDDAICRARKLQPSGASC